ncbi:MAG TPA: helix-turn-helix transcriptional regulator [Thermoanaerobaculia bacterium]|jgi:DNA-binding Xre family transcriptional regulator
MLKTTVPPSIQGVGLAEPTGAPVELVVEPDARLLSHEVKASIQNQYFVAAEEGKISKIRAWRIMRGMDQGALAARAGMTQPEISRAERVGQTPRMKGETLKRIADALQVRIDELF